MKIEIQNRTIEELTELNNNYNGHIESHGEKICFVFVERE